MTAQPAQRRAVQADRRVADDLLHDVGGSRPKATGRAVVLADEARKTATECGAAGDRPGGAAWWAVAGDGYRDAVERADGREPLVIV